MNSNFGVFLLFSVIVAGLIICQSPSLLSSNDFEMSFNLQNIAFAEETQGNTTSTNSTSITLDETMNIGDDTVNPGDNMTGHDNATITLDETMKIGNDTMKSEQVVSNVVLSPLKQIKGGVMSKDVICKEGLELAFKFNGQAACVKTSSVQKLITRGWIT